MKEGWAWDEPEVGKEMRPRSGPCACRELRARREHRKRKKPPRHRDSEIIPLCVSESRWLNLLRVLRYLS
jgi:hypothetical protein